ncbi:MAG TPA: MaoC family dehydratase [Gammaproteobacteria bacterium]|nr:MaoC family dehydratase [Gammaproteobacteria bacterium]
MTKILIDGPYFEDFTVGQTFSAPSITLTTGHAAMYQAITGDRMRLPLDHQLSRRVTGNDAPFAHPHLVVNVVNGQTTYPSQHVKGNLFYRGLILRRPVFIGDTLTTSTKSIGLKQNRPKPGRPATGMVALEMETSNQHGEIVMQYWRCPMIPCRDPQAETGHDADFSVIEEKIAPADLAAAIPADWELAPLVSTVTGLKPPRLETGDDVSIVARDTITCAPELVRLTLNIAYAHTDATKSYLGKRLVYGGHTISLALAQITRALPAIITVVAWSGCDHTGPVVEEDLIRSQFKVLGVTPAQPGGSLVNLHVESFAARSHRDSGELEEHKVLDWRLTVWTL